MYKLMIVLLLLLAVPCFSQGGGIFNPAQTPAVEPPDAGKWEVSLLGAVAPSNKSGACLSFKVVENDQFSVWADVGTLNDNAVDEWGIFAGASTDWALIPLFSKWFSDHITDKARYGVGYSYPSTDVLLYIRVPVTDF